MLFFAATRAERSGLISRYSQKTRKEIFASFFMPEPGVNLHTGRLMGAGNLLPVNPTHAPRKDHPFR